MTTVSVVVPTRNSIRTLDACLASVRAQRGVDVELVVVDNHSSDGTPDVARRHAHRVLTAGPERSAQRNAGVRAGTAEWICWIDSDMVLPPQTLLTALDVAAAEGVRAVSVPEFSVGSGFWTACRALERSCYVDDGTALHNPRLLRRDLFDELGGFNEDLAGPEDADLRLRLVGRGERLGYAPQVLIEHDEGRLTLRGVWAKRVYYGRSLPGLASEHSHSMVRQGVQVLQAYWRNRRRLLRHPVLTVGVVVLRVVDAAGYLYGYRAGRRDG